MATVRWLRLIEDTTVHAGACGVVVGALAISSIVVTTSMYNMRHATTAKNNRATGFQKAPQKPQSTKAPPLAHGWDRRHHTPNYTLYSILPAETA